MSFGSTDFRNCAMKCKLLNEKTYFQIWRYVHWAIFAGHTQLPHSPTIRHQQKIATECFLSFPHFWSWAKSCFAFCRFLSLFQIFWLFPFFCSSHIYHRCPRWCMMMCLEMEIPYFNIQLASEILDPLIIFPLNPIVKRSCNIECCGNKM